MPEAGEQTTTTWTPISCVDTVAWLTKIYQSQTIAEEKIASWLVAGLVRWDCLELIGTRRVTDPGRGDRKFWHGLPKSAVRLTEGWARRRQMSADRRHRPIALCDYKVVGLVFAREDVFGLLPPAEQARLAEADREAETLAKAAREAEAAAEQVRWEAAREAAKIAKAKAEETARADEMAAQERAKISRDEGIAKGAKITRAAEVEAAEVAEREKAVELAKASPLEYLLQTITDVLDMRPVDAFKAIEAAWEGEHKRRNYQKIPAVPDRGTVRRAKERILARRKMPH